METISKQDGELTLVKEWEWNLDKCLLTVIDVAVLVRNKISVFGDTFYDELCGDHALFVIIFRIWAVGETWAPFFLALFIAIVEAANIFHDIDRL